MPDVTPPTAPRLFLVDGYALIYRAFFALIARPLMTGRGENTSAAWGIANFLQRLLAKHQPEYLGWVHDSGLSFRHERYPAYKATREKLSEDLQSDFDRGMERIEQILEGYRIPILKLEGYEADDVIGTLAREGADAGLNVVIVSGDKDFQQLVRERVWLLNPGRGGPASVDEQWVGLENASARLGVPPERVVDYLALVGDSSDNVPGVKGIGDKTACELVAQFGALEQILAAAPTITKKRPREALLEHAELARLSKELVTIRDDLPIALDLDALRIQEPDADRLRPLYLELEFTTLAKGFAPTEAVTQASDQATAVTYTVVDTLPALDALVRRARELGSMSVDTETVIDRGAPVLVDPLRSRLIAISIALEPGEAFYLPLAHREPGAEPPGEAPQAELLLDASGDRAATDAPEERGLERGGDPIAGGPPRENGGADPAGAPSPDLADGTGTPPAAGTARKKSARRKSAAAPSEPTSIAARMLAQGPHPVTNLPPLASDAMAPLRALLEDPAVRKTAQNAKYDMLALRRAGVTLRGLEFDTMLASYVLDPGRRSHGLDVLALEFLDHQMTSYDELCGKGRTQLPFDAVPIVAARDYSCEDADMTLRLRGVFEPQLATVGARALFDDIEVPLVEVLAEMEWQGVTIDVAWFASLKERFRTERERVEREIYEEAGEEFNINSNPQLRRVLFEKLGLPSRKRTATGPSTDASVLSELAEEGFAIPQLLLEYRELFKLEGTYLDALPKMVHPETGRIHTSFNQTVAATGRLSSSDPNLQNIPIRRELGRDIRRGFVPREGWILLGADYSQIELRLLAHLSHDPAFVEAFRSGEDIHKQTAAIIFGVPVELVSSEMRGRAKTINFATIYGQGAHALSRQLRISNGEAKEFISTYFERFGGVRAYLDSMVASARERGYVETIFKRRRYIPEINDRNFNIRAFGERVATNAPIQGSAADVIKIAMIRIDRRLRVERLAAKMLLQVHDELVFEVPPSELEQVRSLVREEMEQAAELSVPLTIEMGTGATWLETK